VIANWFSVLIIDTTKNR